MATLSLTEIRDAFAEEDAMSGGMGPAPDTPMQQLPDHAKKRDPVGPRLAHTREHEGGDHNGFAPRKRSKQAKSTPMTRERHSGDMVKIVNNALILTIGLAFHAAAMSIMNAMFETFDITTFNQICIRLIYPAVVIFAVWSLKR